mmetsp:Transcript_26819/g.42639  ORF Transcript_26819/g.42639 Transcript_26819/m.42639 type:complete len:85 (-) Transcript_26819:263-517(-)
METLRLTINHVREAARGITSHTQPLLPWTKFSPMAASPKPSSNTAAPQELVNKISPFTIFTRTQQGYNVWMTYPAESFQLFIEG